MSTRITLRQIGLGALAGLAGTAALLALRTASQRWYPESMPPVRQDPGEFMVERIEEQLPEEARDAIPEMAETAAAQTLALGYGLTAGALYGALRPGNGNVVANGLALGLATWAVGYLGWLPALGLTPPITEQRATEAIAPAARHVLFGIVAAATLDQLESRFSN